MSVLIATVSGTEIEFVEKLSAMLAFVALIGAVVLLAARLAPGSSWAEQLFAVVRPWRTWLAFAVAAGATLGSLYFSERVGFAPCKLCWYQRCAMYPLAVVLGISAIFRRPLARWEALALAAAGLCVSIWHNLVEHIPSLESQSCKIGVPCATPYFKAFGWVTLTFMAGAAFLAVIALVLVPASRETSVVVVEAD